MKRIVKFLIKVHGAILSGKKYSLAETKAYIDSFAEPSTDQERAYYNYLCCSRGVNPFGKLLTDLAGIAAIPVFMLIYMVNRCFVKKQAPASIILNTKNRVGDSYNYAGRIPGELYEQYGNIKTLDVDAFPGFFEGVLSRKMLARWWAFFIRHPFSGYVDFRALINLAGYEKLLLVYRPEIIVVGRMEVNGMSSLITDLCEHSNAAFINIMHGEVTVNPAAAFVRFSRFYVWDEHYIDVFRWERAAEGQFIVFLPDIYKKRPASSGKCDYYLTYVFTGSETERIDANAERVRSILLGFVNSGKRCKVRPHPRWSDPDQIRSVFGGSGIDIELPGEVSADESIDRSEYMCGTFSTVLTEAYYKGKPVILDDVTIEGLYEHLVECKYFLISKEHLVLSELLHMDDRGGSGK